jgi:hypothetical protein
VSNGISVVQKADFNPGQIRGIFFYPQIRGLLWPSIRPIEQDPVALPRGGEGAAGA